MPLEDQEKCVKHFIFQTSVVHKCTLLYQNSQKEVEIKIWGSLVVKTLFKLSFTI